MNFFQAVLLILVPFIPVVLPGAFFIRIHNFTNILISGARIILWSIGIMTLALTAGLYVGIPVQAIALIVSVSSVANIMKNKKLFFSRSTLWHAMAMIVLMVIGLAAFTIPFFIIHNGLPTGDVQKTIIWANDSLATNHLPDYGRAISLLNRDPVDFYTPGLHAVSSLILGTSPAPLTSIGIFAIVIALCVAWIAAALTKEMFDNHPHVISPILAALFTLTQYRFLRYLREPGYHIQNLVGELFLFGMVLVFIRFIRKKQPQDAILFIVCGAALFLTHQFSMFIAVFTIAAAMIAAIFEYRNRIIHVIKLHTGISIFAGIFFFVALAIGSSLGLTSKLPVLFTRNPHLTSLLPALTDYPATMGEVWFFAGFAGIILMLVQARRRDEHHRQVISFVSATAIILLLSQGPALGIDIPPVRALFYIVVPFSVGAAYFFGKLFFTIPRYQAVLIIIIIATCSSSTYRAYASLSYTVRTNSTLTGEELGLIEVLKNKLSLPNLIGQSTSTWIPGQARNDTEAILIDDYNRRGASWLVLSGRPMFTRIAADLKQQMQEASQSKLRMELYLKQLDFEKIFSLGSMPEITHLFAKNNISAVTGITNSSQTSFMYNTALHPIGMADDITLYTATPKQHVCTSSPECTFLLRSATLANDIGDNEDTFEHLQASIRSARLSEPLYNKTMTYRESSAAYIPLVFNVGNYVRVLWDPNNIHRPETSLTFMIFFTKEHKGLSIKAPSGKIIPIPNTEHVTFELRQDVVQIDDRGFITLTLINPQEQRIGIDLIALGPSLIP